MEDVIYTRKSYIEKVAAYINKPVVKVITGIRRAGKSYFIRQIINLIKLQGVEPQNILYINKESLEFEFISNYRELYDYVNLQFKNVQGKKYLLVDEIQNIEEWEKALTSFFTQPGFDIYITGSNAQLLSSEIATLISGRYIEFQIYTLSFAEFLQFRGTNENSRSDEFLSYMKYGGFPAIYHFDNNDDLIFDYINSLYNTIILKDVISRYNIRNVQLFERLASYIISNAGNVFSGRSISKYLKSQNMSVGVDTIQNYLHYLSSTYLIHKVKRYDLQGKKILNIYEKYYLGDIGLKNVMYGYKETELPGLLENIIFLKLVQNNFQVYVGKYKEYEIDFVARKGSNRIYIQVAYLLNSPETIEREFGVLRKINDNFPKYVITMDNLPESNNDGIIRMNIIDFLLQD